MHTIMVIGGALALLAVILIIARATGSSLARGALIFIPIWFVGAGINMYIGVSQAGYTVAQEAPIFLVVFGVPAIVAGIVWWRISRAGKTG